MKKTVLFSLLLLMTILSSCSSTNELENGVNNLKKANSYKLEIDMYKGNEIYKEDIIIYYFENHFSSVGSTQASFNLVSVTATEIIYFMEKDGFYERSNT